MIERLEDKVKEITQDEQNEEKSECSSMYNPSY
jgi:hypothetical protein